MRNQNRVPNNSDSLTSRIDSLHLRGVQSWSDDGNVGVRVSGGQRRLLNVVQVLRNTFGDQLNNVGDGVQQGDFFVSNNGVQQDWSDFN